MRIASLPTMSFAVPAWMVGLLVPAMFVVLTGPGVSPASAESIPLGDPVPGKAACQVCTANGETHGKEKVRATFEHEGRVYMFCAEGCRDRFQEDPAGYLPPVFPMPAPAFALSTEDGEILRLSDYRGQWLLLDFWATWCQPCIKLMPALDRIHGAFGPKGLAVLGVSIDEKADKAWDFARNREISYPVAFDGGEEPAWNAYRVKVVPTVFLIDPEGNIVARWTGSWDHDELAAILEKHLAE